MNAPSPRLHRRAACKIMVGGKDVTSRIDPHLISVKVIDRFDVSAIDEAAIELDDRDGKLEIPSDKMLIQIYLGWASSGPELPTMPPTPPGSEKQLPWQGSSFYVVFQGKISNVESGFARSGGGGRRLWIEAHSADLSGAGKSSTPFSTWGEGEVKDSNGKLMGGTNVTAKKVFEEAAKKAGYMPFIGSVIGQQKRDFWSQYYQSFHDLGIDMATQLSGLFKIVGNNAILVGKDEGINPMTNKNWETVVAEWGINLIAWRIKPFISRPQWAGGQQHWFDVVNHTWKDTKKFFAQEAPFTRIESLLQLPNPAPNKVVGDQTIDSGRMDSVFERGTGWVIINGDPMAMGGANLQIIGARDGVDATYKITEAEHNYLRAGGYTTRCTLKHPSNFPATFPDGLNVGSVSQAEADRKTNEANGEGGYGITREW